ncbi:MAG: TrkH family potassium uptake protein [Armatimonadota bacterium]
MEEVRMSGRLKNASKITTSVGATLGTILVVFSGALLVPLLVGLIGSEPPLPSLVAFTLPAAGCLLLGLSLCRAPKAPAIRTREAFLVCALAWIITSFLGAFPIWLLVDNTTYLDALFEAVAGLTTTGMTMFTTPQQLPASILFWRAFMQFLGGLGILTFFLAVTFRRGVAQFHLFSAESARLATPRLTPSILRTVEIIAAIYLGLTAAFAVAYALAGMPIFDAMTHSMTSISTGGFSTHGASIDHFQRIGHPNHAAIEWLVIFGMLAGSVNFFAHYRLIRGEWRALWGSIEMRVFWLIIALATVLIFIGTTTSLEPGDHLSLDRIRTVIFQVVAATSTGYRTESINAESFPPVARPVFLFLMFIGGPMGSTSGGLKVLRLVVLFQAARLQLLRVCSPRRAVQPMLLEGQPVKPQRLSQAAGLMTLWLALIAGGTVISMLFTDHEFLSAASGMLSAVSNMGPAYLSAQELVDMVPAVKITYILGMLAGRLEIIPIVLLLSPRAWR